MDKDITKLDMNDKETWLRNLIFKIDTLFSMIHNSYWKYILTLLIGSIYEGVWSIDMKI